MKYSHKKTQQRLLLLQRLIDQHTPGDIIDYSEIIDELSKQEDKEPSRWDRIILKVVNLYNETRDSKACELDIRSGKVLIIEGDASQYEERKKKATLEKNNISTRLLFWLFDQKSIHYKSSENKDDTNFGRIAQNTCYRSNWFDDQIICKNLARKRAVLQNRTVISLLADAGTSTEIFIFNLLNDMSFPLKVHGFEGIRKINPSIFTNSISIAHMISERKDRRNLSLTLLGGVERPDRKSVVGDMALSWARQTRANGALDLSIIGTTGVRESDDCLMGVYMDDDMECELKGEFLQMANFRIVICDASKILMGSCIHIFAAITRANVDLIVVDDGKFLWQNSKSPFYDEEDTVTKKIEDFMENAREQGVGVMVVSSKNNVL